MPGSDALLEVDRVSRSYGDRTALDGVSLTVAAGEVCGLLGPNGAGKTTLVSIIAGLRAADAGVVRLAGQDVSSGGHGMRELVGYAPQETAVYPTVSVRENLELFAGLCGLSRRIAAERIAEVAATLELEHLLERPARFLSGGERRRLHTAIAVVHRPRVLLLDEPTTGVDVASRGRLLEAVRRLASEERCAVLYSTHYLPEVEALDASVVILDRGRVLAAGPVRELVAAHASGWVELTFDGPVPASLTAAFPAAERDGSTVQLRADQPGAAIAEVIAAIGADAARLSGVDLRRPDLEQVFVALTGRRYRSDDEEVAAT